jgi:hypothetical protein
VVLNDESLHASDRSRLGEFLEDVGSAAPSDAFIDDAGTSAYSALRAASTVTITGCGGSEIEQFARFRRAQPSARERLAVGSVVRRSLASRAIAAARCGPGVSRGPCIAGLQPTESSIGGT